MAKDSEPTSRGGASRLARDKVFDVAADLFYRKGIRAVGVVTVSLRKSCFVEVGMVDAEASRRLG